MPRVVNGVLLDDHPIPFTFRPRLAMDAMPTGNDRKDNSMSTEHNSTFAAKANLLMSVAHKMDASGVKEVVRLLSGGAPATAQDSAFERPRLSISEERRNLIYPPGRRQTQAEAADYAKRFPNANRLGR